MYKELLEKRIAAFPVDEHARIIVVGNNTYNLPVADVLKQMLESREDEAELILQGLDYCEREGVALHTYLSFAAGCYIREGKLRILLDDAAKKLAGGEIVYEMLIKKRRKSEDRVVILDVDSPFS